MQFRIPVGVYVRLANVTKRMPARLDDTEKMLLSSIRLENLSGKLFALATNRSFMAVYMIGDTAEPDGSCSVIVDPMLVQQCETEKPFNSSINFVSLPELNVVSAKTDLGYNYPGNIGMFAGETILSKWRELKAEIEAAGKSGGFGMTWTCDDIAALNAASPSGVIVFPEVIDVRKPIIVRDINDPNWLGMLRGDRLADNGKPYTVKGAELPKWFP